MCRCKLVKILRWKILVDWPVWFYSHGVLFRPRFPELVDDVLADVVPSVAVVEDQLLVVDGRQPAEAILILHFKNTKQETESLQKHFPKCDQFTARLS